MRTTILLLMTLMVLTSLTIGVADYSCGNATTACGWNELINGSIISAAYRMYDSYLLGWVAAILYLVFEFMLVMKSRNMVLVWITTAIFLGIMYVPSMLSPSTTNPLIHPAVVPVAAVVLVVTLGSLVYTWFWK